MIRNQFSIFIIVIIFAISCAKKPSGNSYYEKNYSKGNDQYRSGLELGRFKTKYPIDVFFGSDLPQVAIDTIQLISITEEEILDLKTKIVQNRITQTGKNINEKELILNQLIEKAIDLNANCLVKVNYKYFIGQDSQGYTVSGIAGHYSLKEK